MAGDETHHVKMLMMSVFGDSDSGTAANRGNYSTTVILKVKAGNLVPEISNR